MMMLKWPASASSMYVRNKGMRVLHDVSSACSYNVFHRLNNRLRLVGVALGMALLAIAYGLSLLTHTVRLDVAGGDVKQAIGRSFIFPFKGWPARPWALMDDTVKMPTRSNLSLYEDGRPLGPPHTAHEAIRENGGGGYSHWQRNLVFSTSDNSDPRTNGRVYSVSATATLALPILYWVVGVGGGCLFVSLVALAWCHRQRFLGAYRHRAAHLWMRRFDYVAAGAFPFGVTVCTWLFLPPIWNGFDSTNWLLWQWGHFPHFPILYPALMALATGLFAGSPAAIAFATGVQHLAFVGAIIYLASAYRERWKIVVVSVLACLGGALGLYAQGLFTEGLDLPFLFIAIGAVLRLRRGGIRLSVGLALFVGLLGGMLTRHASIVFAALPVAYVFFAALLSERRRSLSGWKPLGSVIAIVLAATVTAQGITAAACHVLGQDCISIIGRAGVYRILGAYELVPQSQRGTWLDEMTMAAPDAVTSRALNIMVQASSPWLGTRQMIAADPSLKPYDPDTLMNGAFWVIARTSDVYVLEQWGRELFKVVFGTVKSPTECQGEVTCNCSGAVNCLLRVSAHGILVVFPANDVALRSLQGTGAEHLESAGRYHELAGLPATRLLDLLLSREPLVRAPLLVTAWLLAIAAVWAQRRADFTALMVSIWLGFVAYGLVVTFVTIVIPRYLAPLDLLLWLSNAIAIVALLESAPSIRRRGPWSRRAAQ